MKLLMVIFSLFLGLTALPQSAMERMGAIFGPPEKKKSAGEVQLEELAAKREAEKQRQAALDNPANYRVVAGRLYNAALSTNWVSLPGQFFRGKFERMTSSGPLFLIEARHGGTSLRPLIWYQFDRFVIVTNYPTPTRVSGEAMKPILALPIATTPDGYAVFDHGCPPQKQTHSGTDHLTTTSIKP